MATDLNPRPFGRPPRGNIRMLLGCTGWPSGVLEVGSWAKHTGLAEPIIFQLQPGYALRLDAEDRQYLALGPVDPELVDSFIRHGRRLSADSEVTALDARTWLLRDQNRDCTYRLVDEGDGLDVLIPANYEHPRFFSAVRRFAQRQGRLPEFFRPDGSYQSAVHDALLAVGGAFIEELIAMDPHLVGFRIEGGELNDILAFIRAVRLFSDAEVILGGPTATSHPEDVFRECGPDYVFAGEAEEPLAQFLQLSLEPNSKDRQPEIPGLVYRYGGRVYYNTLPRDGYERTVLEVDRQRCGLDLRCVRNLIRPVADREVIAANRLDWSLLQNFTRELDSLFFTGGRGCPGACTFCAKLHGQEVRVKSARQLLEEIEAADMKVADGTLQVTQWPLFKYTNHAELRDAQVAWAAIFDEDFLLNRDRAIEFFRLWDQCPLKSRYRLNLQTNPCSLLAAGGRVHQKLLEWIDRLKPMIQLGAESFNAEVLARWHKRHTIEQLQTVLDALDGTRQDYNVFQLLTDFETTPEELIESLRLLILNAYRRPGMRIASTAYTIPLYDSETRRRLEHRGLLGPERVRHFTDFERPQPGWMDPLVAELADLADAELQSALIPEQRDAALGQAMEALVERLQQDAGGDDFRIGQLLVQARTALAEVREARFRAIP